MPGLAKKIRIAILLYILFLVAVGTWLTSARTTSWNKTLWVAVYPINGDGSPRSAEQIAKLSDATFEPIDTFMDEQAEHYGLPLHQPFHLTIGQTIAENPPPPPRNGNVLRIMLWSLSMRLWAWRVDKGPNPPASDIDLFVRYFDPDTHPTLEHSFGLQKGLVGVVNVFASRHEVSTNNVVIAHELLHTVGATDKYNLATNQPLYPIGYADPQAQPLFPQHRATLMAGRIPVSPSEAVMPRSLAQVVISPATTLEIGWTH
ncbi:MAG: hypothetical protein H6970_03230 [Gammaproteobacteria bacterium]|nr:hypothetical protein [Gammaproteobacteria bacterium]MCP5424070.1 hypothetical protein [Gammaproteobacteria bacterium]MCP5459465.1 hypothetical protein [Gammaproteobacteria bacterium]